MFSVATTDLLFTICREKFKSPSKTINLEDRENTKCTNVIVYLDTTKSSSSFNSVLNSFNPLFLRTVGIPGSCSKHPLDKTESVDCSFGCISIPYPKKASPYLRSLKYYFKSLWACPGITLKKTYIDLNTHMQKINLIT